MRIPKMALYVGLTCAAVTAGSWTRGAIAEATAAPRWDASRYGNHRYLVQVSRPAEAVHVVIPWRRHDADPAGTALIVVGPDGHEVDDFARGTSNQASGELVFQATQAGQYAVYYQPYRGSGRANYPTFHYLASGNHPDSAWQRRFGNHPQQWSKLPEATLLGYQAIDDFNAYTDMEQVASPSAVADQLAAHPGAMLIFPENRDHPVRMFNAIPQRWAERGPGGGLDLSALRDEYLSFQIGVWAPHGPLDLNVKVGDLAGPHGAVIPASAMTCFNQGGVDYAGQTFTSPLAVAAGHVLPLWLGVAVPADAPPGVYRGQVTVSAQGVPSQQVALTITVQPGTATAHGDDDPSKLTRLRWLNSRVAQDSALVKPFTAITTHDTTLGILGREIELAPNGLPRQLSSRFDERMTGFASRPTQVLAAPINLFAHDDHGTHALAAAARTALRIERDGPAKVHWRSINHLGDLAAVVEGSLEADGTLSYQIAVTAPRPTDLTDLALRMPLQPDVAEYEMGLGQQGADAPAALDWHWNVAYNQDGAWIGKVNAGLEFHLRDEHYRRPLNTNFYQQQPLRIPLSWDNAGRGGIRLHRDRTSYEVLAYSGPRHLEPGQTLHYNLVLRVTPFKPIDPAAHFAERYYHHYADLGMIQALGANVVNVHHATAINPWINYPFLRPQAMRDYVDEAHRRGMRVKIYDTIRELSDRAPELPVLEALGHEVISTGPGGGFPWLQEHLDGDYIAGWHVPENGDASIIDAGQSRWHNYYVEGLDWLARNVGIDGLYLDDVAYDRTTMMRVRKVLERRRPNPLIDLHSASQFDARDGYISSALLYMELFPYIDRLWFGEEFDYQHTSPAYWLTEISGIPYGVMGEMLQDGGNPWRGMLFGMTNRLPWTKGDPRALWKLWDAFEIGRSQMIGWWVHDAPVRTDQPDVLATSYVQPGKTLVALASWSTQPARIHLRINWKALSLDPAKTQLVAPAIEGFQPAANYRASDSIPVEPGKGWLLILEDAP